MTELERSVLDKLRRSLDPARLDAAIVYLDPGVRRAGERCTLGDATVEMPWDGHLAFVDLEPQANWGHACLYLAVRLAGAEVVEHAARMPPFLKPGAADFRLLLRGPRAPEWAVATG